jgi:hypothetical protein
VSPDRPSLPVRLAAVAGGFVLLLVAVVLFWMPSAAVATALTGLQLISLQWEWAARAQGRLLVRQAEGRDWFASLSLLAKFAWCAVLAIVVVAIIVLLFGR